MANKSPISSNLVKALAAVALVATAVFGIAIAQEILRKQDDPSVTTKEQEHQEGTVGIAEEDPTAEDTEFVKSRDLGELPEAVQAEYIKYCQIGWKGLRPGSASGTKAGGVYNNRNGVLPATNGEGETLHFKEYDVYDKMPGQNRGTERFVVSFNPDGSIRDVYYTSDHYDTFTRIIDKEHR